MNKVKALILIVQFVFIKIHICARSVFMLLGLAVDFFKSNSLEYHLLDARKVRLPNNERENGGKTRFDFIS